MKRKKYIAPNVVCIALMEELCNGVMTTSITKTETPDDFPFDPSQGGAKGGIWIDDEYEDYEE